VRIGFNKAIPGVLCLAVLLVPSVARSQDQQAFLEIVVNGVAKGNVLVVMRQDDVLVPAAALTEAGLNPAAGTRTPAEGGEHVSLRSLAPSVTFVVEEQNLRLVITARADLLGRTTYDFQPGAPANIVYASAPSAFVNYALTSSVNGGSELFTETAITARGGTFYNTLTQSSRGSVRGLTNVTFDERRGLRRWTLGDNFVDGGVLGGSTLIGGLTISRDFSLEPYFVQFPTQSMTAAVSSPSTVEVYVNDRLVRQERVDPGLVDLRNLPLMTGQNQTRVIVRDSFGAEREVTGGYYVTASLLAPGLHDYQYSVGLRRSGLGVLSADYGKPVAVARHRVGLTSWLTAGGRLEADQKMTSGGPMLNVRLPIGEVEAAAAMSRATGVDVAAVRGSAARVSYQFTSRTIAAGATVARTSSSYATSSLVPGQLRAELEQSLFVSVPLASVGSISVNHSLFDSGASGARQQTSLSSSIRLFRNSNMLASVSRVRTAAGQPSLQATVGVTVNLGRRTLVTTSATRDEHGTGTMAEVQRSMPFTTGLGYQLRGETIGTRRIVSGAAQYQSDFGRYEVRHDGTNATVSAAGALVAIGGSLHATRPIRNSFALVQVPGVEEVRTYSSHQEVGKTNRRGNVLITDLFPYYANELSIADTDIPLDYKVSDVNIQLAPPYRGGAIVRFPVQKIQRTVGTVLLMVDGRPKPPAYGELTVTVGKEQLVSPVGADGQFYFDSLPPGRHPAAVAHGGETCSFTLEIPAAATDLVDLGETRCVADRR
jgi:outer membrane usher protein